MLAHFIEEAGVPTATISLIRPHTEIIKPPRALWVPFELGRPLGAPDNTPFQRRVLLAMMKLLEASAGPVLEDFPDDAPESASELTVLACPVLYSQPEAETGETDPLEAAFRREMAAIRPWYDLSVAKRKRTTVGISSLEIESIGDFIYAFSKGREPENPREDMELVYTVKFAAEDLKAYYTEGITSQPGQEGASSQMLMDWFWYETKAGEVLLDVKQVCEASADKLMNSIGRAFIVPPKVASRMNK